VGFGRNCKLYWSTIRPTVTYDIETWGLEGTVNCKLMVFERKVPRKMFGPTKERDGAWRIKTKYELDEIIRYKNTINYIKARSLFWFGDLHRMLGERIIKKVYKWKPMLRRPLGKPKNRWEGDIRKDMKKLKIKNRTGCIQDRNKWKLDVERGKTFSD
jgi:hypothetical protein